MTGNSAFPGWRTAAAAQAALAAAAFLMVAFSPPEVGRTLLIPLDGRPISEAMLERSALMRFADGPLPGSVLVEGRGRILASSLLGQGIVMLAAPAALCVASAPGERRNG
jgi:hypothetical protein